MQSFQVIDLTKKHVFNFILCIYKEVFNSSRLSSSCLAFHRLVSPFIVSSRLSPISIFFPFLSLLGFLLVSSTISPSLLVSVSPRFCLSLSPSLLVSVSSLLFVSPFPPSPGLCFHLSLSFPLFLFLASSLYNAAKTRVSLFHCYLFYLMQHLNTDPSRKKPRLQQRLQVTKIPLH